MLRISTWDEISGEWETRDVKLPHNERDPKKIARTTDPEGGNDGWRVKISGQVGPVFVIEVRSDRNHLGLILVNSEDQDDCEDD